MCVCADVTGFREITSRPITIPMYPLLDTLSGPPKGLKCRRN